MIARLDNLRKHPAVFRRLTGITVAVFDALADAVVRPSRRPTARRSTGPTGSGPSAAGMMKRLPKGVGGIGDRGYVGIGALHPSGLGASPRRKPRGKERPPADRTYNRAFSRRRIIVEHGIGRLRRFAAVSHVNRHGRKGHAVRVRAIAGRVNRMIDA